MKIVKRIIVGIVLVAAVVTGGVIGYHFWQANQTPEYDGAYFTLGEDGTTHYIPEKKIEEHFIEEEVIPETILFDYSTQVWT